MSFYTRRVGNDRKQLSYTANSNFILKYVQNINDLSIPPANHLEKLDGNLKGLHSIRINKQWRISFKWKNDNAFEVQIIDYH